MADNNIPPKPQIVRLPPGMINKSVLSSVFDKLSVLWYILLSLTFLLLGKTIYIHWTNPSMMNDGIFLGILLAGQLLCVLNIGLIGYKTINGIMLALSDPKLEVNTEEKEKDDDDDEKKTK